MGLRVLNRRCLLIGGVAALLLLAVVGPWVQADRTVGARARRIKACVLLVPTPDDSFAEGIKNGAALPPAQFAQQQYWPSNPYVFYILNKRTDLKPDGWEYFNPAAPGTATEQQMVRWDNIVGGGRGRSGLSPGVTRLAQNHAAYWEVPLNADNFDRLAQMDIIYLPVWQITNFTEEQRKMLTRLVDGGALLWIDWAHDTLATQGFTLGGGGPALGRPDPFFMPVDMAAVSAPAGAWQIVPHELLRGYFKLTDADTMTLGLAPPNAPDVRGPRGFDLSPPFGYPAARSGSMIANIIYGGKTASTNSDSAYVAAGRYGSGFVVATAGNVGGAISGGIVWAPRWRVTPDLLPPPPASPPDLMVAETVDMKFAYNVAWFHDESNHPQKATRHVATGNSPLQGLIERWSHNGRNPMAPGQPTPSLLPPLASPLIVDNAIISVMIPVRGSVRFHVSAYEAEPADDYNRSGSLDNGLFPDNLDYAIGEPYDRLADWQAPGTFVSGLAYGEQNGQGYIFVSGQAGTDGGGWVLFAPNPGASAGSWLQPLATSASMPNRPAWSAPVFSCANANPTATLYMSGGAGGPAGGGLVAGWDFNNGGLNANWHFPPGSAADIIGAIVSSPVPAQLVDRRTGAIDRMVLYSHLHNAKGPGGIDFLVLSTCSEPLGLAPPNGQPIPNVIELVAFRRTERWDPSPGTWELRILDRIGPNAGFTHVENGKVFRYHPVTPGSGVQFNIKNQIGRISVDNSLLPNDFYTGGGLAKYAIVADYNVAGLADTSGAGLPGAVSQPRRFFLPAFYAPGGPGGSQTGIAGGIAVGPDDLAYYGTGRGYMTAISWENSQASVRWKTLGLHAEPTGRYQGSDNVNLNPYGPTWLSDHAFVNTPAVTREVAAFASREGVAYVYDANATITFKLPTNGPLTPQQVSQLDLAAKDENGTIQRIPRNQFTVDADSATVTIADMKGLTLDLRSAIRPPRPGVPGDPNLGGRPGIEIQWLIANQTQTPNAVVPIPLVYYFDINSGVNRFPADRFSAAPVISGDRLYLAGESGLLYELPLDPRKSDALFGSLNLPPDVDVPPAGPSLSDLDLALWRNGALVRVREIAAQPASRVAACLAAPAVGQNLLVASTVRGTAAYYSPELLVADNNRVVEASGDSELLAGTDAVTKQVIQGTEFPIPTDPKFTQAFGRPIVTTRKFLDRPSVARRLNRSASLTSVFLSTAPTNLANPGVTEHSEISDTSNLVAETGGNRIVEYNPAGKVIWELLELQDPWKLLPAGEPRTLSGPTDVTRWVDTEVDLDPSVPAPKPPLLVFHTLVADPGNSRILEVVDKIRYRAGNFAANSFAIQPGETDFAGTPIQWYHVLVWTSQTNGQGLRLKYRNAQRVFATDENGSYIPDPSYVAGVPSSLPPYLPRDQFLTVTLATVNGQQVFFRTNTALNRRLPVTRLGGDTLLFLVGRQRLAAGPGGGVVVVDTNFREADQGAPVYSTDPDKQAFVQGAIDPFMPLIRDVYVATPNGDLVAHTLNGISSVQRTRRKDGNFTPSPNPAQIPLAQYYLIADAGGVYEFRLDLNPALDPNQYPVGDPRRDEDHRARLAWAFTKDDFAYVTGAGWGQFLLARDPATAQYRGEAIPGIGPFFRIFTPSSARWLSNGRVLVASRTSTVATSAGAAVVSSMPGADVFMLRPSDFVSPPLRTVLNPNGWVPDLWVQFRYMVGTPTWPQIVSPSIVWRTPATPRPLEPPTPPNLAVDPTQKTGQTPLAAQVLNIGAGGAPPQPNPPGLFGTYVPQQPEYADVVF